MNEQITDSVFIAFLESVPTFMEMGFVDGFIIVNIFLIICKQGQRPKYQLLVGGQIENGSLGIWQGLGLKPLPFYKLQKYISFPQ